jgi:hypothetical protein
MANIRVLASLEKTASDMNKIREQVVQYSGVDIKDAFRVQAACDEIEMIAKEIYEVAKKVRVEDYAKSRRK